MRRDTIHSARENVRGFNDKIERAESRKTQSIAYRWIGVFARQRFHFIPISRQFPVETFVVNLREPLQNFRIKQSRRNFIPEN